MLSDGGKVVLMAATVDCDGMLQGIAVKDAKGEVVARFSWLAFRSCIKTSAVKQIAC